MASLGKTVLIGGGSGFIGSNLSKVLKEKGYWVVVVSRMPGPQRISWNDLAKTGIPENTEAVVNLAGQNVLDPTRRWTVGFKQNVWTSRINSTAALGDAINKADQKPKLFLSISGVGIYQPSETIEYTEESKVTSFDFLSKLCVAWEAAGGTDATVRRVIIRSGVVLGRDGGMIKQLWLPFYFGLGGPVGSGNQFLPWIHISDLTNLIVYAIENPQVTGVLNGVAPQVITNKEFSTAFGRAMWRPSLLPLPEFIVNLAFSPERAKIMTEGQKVIPKRTLETGFKFEYPNVDSACKHIVAGDS